MIELIEEYQNLGHDVCFMITCAGNYVFEHYVDGKIVHDEIAEDDERKRFFYGIVNNYLCELKDMS